MEAGRVGKSLQLNHEGSKGSSNAKMLELKSPCGYEKASAKSTNCSLCHKKLKGNLLEMGALNAIGKERETSRPEESGILAIAPAWQPKVRR
ncbi:hypothetical protein Ancab_008820 [Ancistrocladus abbreviatus]